MIKFKVEELDEECKKLVAKLNKKIQDFNDVYFELEKTTQDYSDIKEVS